MDIEGFLNADLLVCENGSVWDTSNTKEPKNLSKPFQERNIPINFVHESFSRSKKIVYHILGGPTGLWASFNEQGFEECEIPGFYSWQEVKEFKNFSFEWFFDNLKTIYFNAKGNVYSKALNDTFYKLVWENRQIVQLNGGREEETFSGCLLDNGQVWVKDSPSMTLFKEDEFKTRNDGGWIHLSFYDDKNVKFILAMEVAIYVLCESPEQKLYYHSDLPQNLREDEENEDEINNTDQPIEDKSISSKKIIKMVCLSEIIFCWCEEGIYAWVVDNGASPFSDTEDHPVCRFSEQFYPFKFFENKNILDIGASSIHFYVLCDDGVYTIPSKVEDDDAQVVQIVPIKLPFFDENIPVMFSSYFNSQRKLGKSARSRLDTEQPPTKKQKLDHTEEETDV